MLYFKFDFNEFGCKEVMDGYSKLGQEKLGNYHSDRYTKLARQLIKKEIGKDADIYFLSNGTQTNLVFLDSALNKVEAVISPDSAHINNFESGATESAGIKIVTTKNKDAKIQIQDIQEVLNSHNNDTCRVIPKLVFITLATEYATIYTKKELQKLYTFCKSKGLYLYIDGARIGCALTASGSDITLKDIAKNCDAFYIGGTKNGLPMGEALCIINPKLKPNFIHYMKKHGALMAKTALMSYGFYKLFKEGLFYKLAQHANMMAEKLRLGLRKLKYEFYITSQTNQVFVIIDKKILSTLKNKVEYMKWKDLDKNYMAVRFSTSWATTEDEVEKLLYLLDNKG